MKTLVYCTDWCPDCKRLRRYFELNQIEFTEWDVDNDKKAFTEMLLINGNVNRIPTVIVGDKVLIEPRAWQLDEILDLMKD